MDVCMQLVRYMHPDLDTVMMIKVGTRLSIVEFVTLCFFFFSWFKLYHNKNKKIPLPQGIFSGNYSNFILQYTFPVNGRHLLLGGCSCQKEIMIHEGLGEDFKP